MAKEQSKNGTETKPKTSKRPVASKSKALVARPVATADRPQNISSEYLLAEAVKKGAPIDTLERLMVLRKTLKEEWAQERFFDAMAAFQAECPVIAKTVTVTDNAGKPRFKYAPLGDIVAAVKELLNQHGFSYTIKSEEQDQHVTATCYAHHVDGHTESSTATFPIDTTVGSSGRAIMNAPQRTASAQMYAKRYAFCNVFGILTADHDDAGQAAGGNGSPPEVTASEKPEETIGINTLYDRILGKLRCGAFAENERFTLENRLTDIHKQKNAKAKAMTAFEENIDRQIKFKRGQQNASDKK